jgi:hypothetical protein
MKRFVFLTLLTLSIAWTAYGQSASDFIGPERGFILSDNANLNPLYKWAASVEDDLEAAGGIITPGDVYYVNSNVASAGDGTSWDAAVETIQEAVDLCTADNGDIIYVAPSHAENIASAAELDFDCAGITVIGLGSGDQMPTISMITAATATVQISAADVTIKGIRFLGNYTNGITQCLDITANGDGAKVVDCEFRETTNLKELLIMITLTANADSVVVWGNRFLGESGGTDSVAINLEGGSDKSVFAYNTFIGDWSGYVVDGSTAASTEIIVANNYLNNADTTAGKTMGFHASTTGNIYGNECYGNGASYAFVGDALFVSPTNVFCNVEDVETAVTYYDLLSAILTDTATLDSASELKTLLFGSDTAGAPATATTAITAYQEKWISKATSTIANGNNDLFVVAGGPIKILEIVTYITSNIGSEGCLIGYNVDPTSPATDTVFGTDGTALECNGMVAGGYLRWDGVLANDLTLVTYGVGLGTPTTSGLIVPAGSIELTAAHDGTCAGALKTYMRYVPLDTGVTVTAAP